MKNISIILLFLSLSITVKAQEKEQITPNDYTITMDSLLKFVKKDKMKTSLLYDRVVDNAGLLTFNDKKENPKSSSYWHYIQALSEVHRSSLDAKNVMQSEVVDDLRHKNDNVLNISYINTSLDYIDYGTEKEPNLVFKDGFFYNIEDRNPFKQKQVTVVAALTETVFYQDIKIGLNPDMVYQDDANPIKNLTAVVNGTEIKLVSNFENLKTITDYKLKGNEKEIVFNIEFKNETKMQTKATIKVSLPQLSNLGTNGFPLEEDFVESAGIDHNAPENTIPFQGYNETEPIYGKIDYRTYYNLVTNNGSAKSKIKKPVIILDGFDPGDKRKIYKESVGYDSDSKSLYELMVYDPDNNPKTENNQNFVKDILRPAGFDVTLVNFTENKIVHPTQPTREVWVQTNNILSGWHIPGVNGHWTTVTNYLHLADGGADYIERNAMALVALLKRENQKLIDNGSTEQITLIGPSMGGLISRYALAYMEKNNIPHNVKLWVSFDSPHLGANVPIAAQAQMLFLGTIGESAEALEKYKSNLQSPAARQMLIEQVDNYPNPTSMWSNNNKNNNHPFRQQFLQNQITNSLPNTKGFPTSMRKISLINGTTNGMKTNSEGQLVYDVAVFGTFNLKGFYNVDRNQATPGNQVNTFEGRYTKKIYCGIPFTNMTYLCGLVIVDAWRNDVNINPRGCMDVVPGGTSDTVGEIKKSIDENPDIQENRIENRMYVPNHAFIPTISSLAFKNDNFDWSAPINRNLICDPANKEIPFDSYFSPSSNEEHVFLTKESVAWLIKEINGEIQAPSFPVLENALSGPSAFCINETNTYSFSDICKLPSAVDHWTITSSASISNPTALSVTVTSLQNDNVTLTAHFQNGQTFKKIIHIGPLSSSINDMVIGGWDNVSTTQQNQFSITPLVGATSYDWAIRMISNNCGYTVHGINPITGELDDSYVAPPLPSNIQLPSFVYGSDGTNVTINWGNCTGLWEVNVKANNRCGAHGVGYKVVNVFSNHTPNQGTGPGQGGSPCDDANITANPNPVSGGQIEVNVVDPPCDDNPDAGLRANNTVKIYDLYGALHYEAVYDTNKIIINNIKLGKGYYVINVTTDSKQILREILIVN